MTTRSEDKMYRLLCDTINKVATGQATIKEAELMADLAKLVKENNRLREQVMFYKNAWLTEYEKDIK